jgi:hypothetical protein
MGRAKGGKGERWKSERKGKEGGKGGKGLTRIPGGGWMESKSGFTPSIAVVHHHHQVHHIITMQRKLRFSRPFSRIFVRQLGKTSDPDSLSEFPACLILYLSLTSSIKIPMRRLARSGAVLTETRLIGSSVRVVDGVLVDMMNRRDGREACARRSSLRWVLVSRYFRAVNIAGRRSTILLNSRDYSWSLPLSV